MKIYKNGWRWREYYLFNDEQNLPYDYERKGLLVKLLPKAFTQSKNKVFQAVLGIIERPSVFILKMIDVVANFRSINYRNY